MARITIIQFDPQARSVSHNIAYIAQKTAKLQDSLVVLPEFSLSSYAAYTYVARGQVKHILQPLSRLGQKNALGFVGSLPVRSNGRTYNRGFYLIDGEVHTQDKVHLFGDEQKDMRAGPRTRKMPFRYKDVLFSLQICLDIKDPLLSHKAVKAGATLIVNPATVSVDFLRIIGKSRALENGVTTVFCNRSGTEADGTRYLGASSVFYPNGAEQKMSGKFGMLSFELPKT